LPAEYGNWNSVWQRFWPLSRSGVFEAFFQLLAEQSRTAHLVQFFDSTVVRAHVSAAGAKGGSKIRRSAARAAAFRRKSTSKPTSTVTTLDFHLTGGEVSDTTQLETSLHLGSDITPRVAITGKGVVPTARQPRRAGLRRLSPRKANAKDRGRFFPKKLYKLRARVEQAMGKLKRFKHIALRCDKTKASFTALTSFACSVILIKSVHTA
jgi:transposase